jgi:hypothetical protein
MWYFNGQIIKTPKTMVISDVTYPPGIFRDSDMLTSLGIKPYREVSPDSRYYNNGAFTVDTSGAEVVGTYASTAKPLADLRARMLADADSAAASRHTTIDWYWSRASKGGTAVPANIATYATTLYSEHETIKTAIAACNTMAKIKAYEAKPHTETRKVKHTAENGDVTYGPDTETSTRHINMCTHYSANPTDEVDPAFVSLVAD